MSFLFRPTPVIVLSGKTVGDDHVPLRRLPAGTMQGYTPNQRSQALNSIGRRTLRGDPWIISSGTMGRFVLGDDSLPPDFFSGVDASPVLPDVPSLPPDFFSGGGTPILPIANLPALGPAPNIGIPSFATGGIPFYQISGPAAPGAPASPGQTQATVAAGTSLLSSIANFFKPTVKATPMTAAMPGVYNATTVTPSWFGQETMIAGTPNYMVLVLGTAGLLLLSSVLIGGKAGLRR